MPDPYSCTIYIDTDEDMDQLEAALDKVSASIFSEFAVEVPLYRNESFDVGARSRVPYDFMACSPYYVEVGTIDEIPKLVADFQSGVAAFVQRLRDEGRFVTASCDFEDVVVDATGWNWTEENTEPPGRVIPTENP